MFWPHHLIQRQGPEAALPMDRIHPFLPEGVLLSAPEETLYALWWAAARTDTFKPAPDLAIRRWDARALF